MATKDEKNTFSIMIEEIASKQNISHMEAIIDHCTNVNLEIEVAASLINSSLKAKIEEEARDLRFLPKTSKLPL